MLHWTKSGLYSLSVDGGQDYAFNATRHETNAIAACIARNYALGRPRRSPRHGKRHGLSVAHSQILSHVSIRCLFFHEFAERCQYRQQIIVSNVSTAPAPLRKNSSVVAIQGAFRVGEASGCRINSTSLCLIAAAHHLCSLTTVELATQLPASYSHENRWNFCFRLLWTAALLQTLGIDEHQPIHFVDSFNCTGINWALGVGVIEGSLTDARALGIRAIVPTQALMPTHNDLLAERDRLAGNASSALATVRGAELLAWAHRHLNELFTLNTKLDQVAKQMETNTLAQQHVEAIANSPDPAWELHTTKVANEIEHRRVQLLQLPDSHECPISLRQAFARHLEAQRFTWWTLRNMTERSFIKARAFQIDLVEERLASLDNVCRLILSPSERMRLVRCEAIRIMWIEVLNWLAVECGDVRQRVLQVMEPFDLFEGNAAVLNNKLITVLDLNSDQPEFRPRLTRW